jgi:c-di-GMP-binding flagellar brake protein YcgR
VEDRTVAAKQDDPRKLYLREKLTCRTEIGDRVYTFDVRVEDIDAKGIVTSPPDLGGETVEIGHEVLVRYYRADSAYQFLTKITGWEEQGGRVLMRIGFPSQITRFQRREHVRGEVTGSVRFYLNNDEIPSRGILKDLSAGGVSFHTKQVGLFAESLNPVGRRLLVDLMLSNGDEFIGLPAEVRRVVPEPGTKDSVYVQMRFLDLQPKIRQALDDIAKRNKSRR